MQFLVFGLLLLVAPTPTPTADFWSRFTPAPPGVTVRAPWFVEFGARIDIDAPNPRKPLDRHAVSSGICAYDAPCHFRLSVLLLLEDTQGVMTPVGLRYLMDRPDGTRAEGYARTPEPGGAWSFYRHRNGAWMLLPDGTHAVDEEYFVSSTLKYVATQ